VINFYQLWELLPQAGKIEQVLFEITEEITDVNGKTGKLIVKNADKVELLNKKLIQELREKGVKFTEENLEFITKNIDGMIIFLEKGSKTSGLEHIIEGKWNGRIDFQNLFNGKIKEMVDNIYKAIKNEKYIKKTIDSSSRLSYVYKIQTTKGLREFKIAVGSNGYIVTLFPNW